MSKIKASNKRKEIVFDDEMDNVDTNEELDDVINKISKIVFDEKIDLDKNEEIDDLVNKMSKEGAMAISTSPKKLDTKVDRLRYNKKPRVVHITPSFSHRLPLISERAHSKIKRFVERYSRVGKYSIKDVLVDQDDDKGIPMPALHDDETVLKTYENFKKFDTVIDHSDHLFSTSTSPLKQFQPAKDWVEKIQEEWRILAENLPETIFVRVYDSRMDLLRAVIIGPQGTPYHDALFVFDVYFPSTYPITPPVMRYHSYGLGINPMIYECGEVRLKRFLTVNGLKEEMWVSGTSTMLDLLVCIQHRVLNKNPLLNEPGYLFARGSLVEEFFCLYNENTLIKCLKTMVYTMNKPPKNFEYLVVGHFRKRVHDILMACKDYMEDNKESGSIEFKNDVFSCIKPLIAAFDRIGAKEAHEFIFLTENKSRLPASEPVYKRRRTRRAPL